MDRLFHRVSLQYPLVVRDQKLHILQQLQLIGKVRMSIPPVVEVMALSQHQMDHFCQVLIEVEALLFILDFGADDIPTLNQLK